MIGAIVLSFFSAFQKFFLMGVPLTLTGFIVPISFGGMVGLIINHRTRKIRQLSVELKKSHDELERRVEDRTIELEKTSKDLQQIIIKHKKAEDRYTNLVKSTKNGVAIYEVKGEAEDFIFMELNPAGEIIENQKKEELIGRSIFDARPGVKEFGLIDVMREVWRTGEPKRHPITQYQDKKIQKWYENYVYKLPSSELVVIFTDETGQKQADEVLKNEKRRLFDVINGTNVATWEWNVQSGETIYDERWAEIIGYTLEEISPVSIETWVTYIHPDDLKLSNELLEKHFKGELEFYECETRMKHKNGNWVWVLDRGKVATWIEDGKPLLVSGTHQDITERKQSEEQIKSLLQEKELLLKEVHHRIRNNMSTIKGLLSLQSGTLNNPEAKLALKDAQNRVESMLVLYDKLFLSSDFQNVSTRQYFETLIDEIIKNFTNNDIVRVTYEIEDVMLGAKTIFDLGIIINELITNTMKHAFVGKEQGKISASLTVDEGHATIAIQDDGIELPESVSFENPAAGFGFKLVSMLVKQLDGNIQIERGNGTKFTIKFNIES